MRQLTCAIAEHLTTIIRQSPLLRPGQQLRTGIRVPRRFQAKMLHYSGVCGLSCLLRLVVIVEPVAIDRVLVSVITVAGTILIALLILVPPFVQPVPVDRLLECVISSPVLMLLLLLSGPLLLRLLIPVSDLILTFVLRECADRQSSRRGQSARQEEHGQDWFVPRQDPSPLSLDQPTLRCMEITS